MQKETKLLHSMEDLQIYCSVDWREYRAEVKTSTLAEDTVLFMMTNDMLPNIAMSILLERLESVVSPVAQLVEHRAAIREVFE